MNRPSGDESTVLLTVTDWERVTAREVPEREGRPIVGVDLGGGRAWSCSGGGLRRMDASKLGLSRPAYRTWTNRSVGTGYRLAPMGGSTIRGSLTLQRAYGYSLHVCYGSLLCQVGVSHVWSSVTDSGGGLEGTASTQDGEGRAAVMGAYYVKLGQVVTKVIVCDRFRLAELQDATAGGMREGPMTEMGFAGFLLVLESTIAKLDRLPPEQRSTSGFLDHLEQEADDYIASENRRLVLQDEKVIRVLVAKVIERVKWLQSPD